MSAKKRLAIVDRNKCKPKKCNFECMRACPVNKIGKECITIKKKANISNTLCIGCNMCVSVCPFNAIKIVNLYIGCSVFDLV